MLLATSCVAYDPNIHATAFTFYYGHPTGHVRPAAFQS